MELNFDTEQYQLQFKPHVVEEGYLIMAQFDGVNVIIDPCMCVYTDMEQLYINGKSDLFDIVPLLQ